MNINFCESAAQIKVVAMIRCISRHGSVSACHLVIIVYRLPAHRTWRLFLRPARGPVPTCRAFTVYQRRHGPSRRHCLLIFWVQPATQAESLASTHLRARRMKQHVEARLFFLRTTTHEIEAPGCTMDDTDLPRGLQKRRWPVTDTPIRS